MYPTPETMRAGYELLRTVKPYRRWKLPPADEVEFRVLRVMNIFGEHQVTGRRGHMEHVICVSEKTNGHLNTMIRTIAHEMIHAAQAEAGTLGNKGGHNADFDRRAARVCKEMGWDPKAF